MSRKNSGRRGFLKQAATITALYPFAKAAGSDRTDHKEDKNLNVVCVGAHPDDPESGCGGVLSLYAAAGHKVSIVYLTRGEAGIESKSHDEAASIRTKEAESACKIIGAQPFFFGQIDGSTHFDKDAIRSMQDLLTKLQPNILFTHWPIDTHPDHQVASLLCYQSWLRMNKNFPVYYFEVNGGFQTMQFAPTDYVDITSVAEQKRKSIYAHVSQDPDDIYLNHHKIMQAYRGREIWVKEAEAFVRLDAQKQSISI